MGNAVENGLAIRVLDPTANCRDMAHLDNSEAAGGYSLEVPMWEREIRETAGYTGYTGHDFSVGLLPMVSLYWWMTSSHHSHHSREQTPEQCQKWHRCETVIMVSNM